MSTPEECDVKGSIFLKLSRFYLKAMLYILDILFLKLILLSQF